jgi:hypothetical protein
MTHSRIAFLGGRVRFNAEKFENSHKFHGPQRVKCKDTYNVLIGRQCKNRLSIFVEMLNEARI